MTKIKPPSVAGKFYTDNKDELLSLLETFAKNHLRDYDCSSRAVIVPHAGYYYSGQLANNGIQYLGRTAKNVFIIAPTHNLPFEGLALSNFDKWSTPIGVIEVNQDINQDLIESFDYCNYLDEAFQSEHSAEVQVPFIQKMFPNASIVPILVGNIKFEKITKILNYSWANPDNVFVISSDLSHFHSSADARKIDKITATMIETGNFEGFTSEQACGAVGVLGLAEFAKEKQ